MGTSQSSKGPPSNVPMVPPWVPDIPLPATLPNVIPHEGTPDTGVEQNQTPQIEPRQPIPIAPAGRFRNTRRSLGKFARYGDRGSMRNGVGSYVKNGYGGSRTATRRFGGTTQTANALYSALAVGTDNIRTAPGRQLDPVLMAGRSVDDVMDAVVEAVRPVDGTQDTEAGRAAIKDALAEALTRFPEADLLNLEDLQREFVIESYVAADVFRRFDLDLGKTIVDKSPSAIAGLGRLKEIREYIRETIAASFRKLRNDGQQMVAGHIAEIVKDALYETFRVFEEYAE